MRIKSSGIPPGLANARPPGSAIFANAPQSRALTDAHTKVRDNLFKFTLHTVK